MRWVNTAFSAEVVLARLRTQLRGIPSSDPSSTSVSSPRIVPVAGQTIRS